jgi:hypothetical protein
LTIEPRPYRRSVAEYAGELISNVRLALLGLAIVALAVIEGTGYLHLRSQLDSLRTELNGSHVREAQYESLQQQYQSLQHNLSEMNVKLTDLQQRVSSLEKKPPAKPTPRPKRSPSTARSKPN